MSYDITLILDGDIVLVPKHNEGAIQKYDINGSEGTAEAEISVTYNYNSIYQDVINKTLKQMLDGKRASDTLADLKQVIAKCGTRQALDYWADTPGNAGHTAAILADWANLHPKAIWVVH